MIPAKKAQPGAVSVGTLQPARLSCEDSHGSRLLHARMEGSGHSFATSDASKRERLRTQKQVWVLSFPCTGSVCDSLARTPRPFGLHVGLPRTSWLLCCARLGFLLCHGIPRILHPSRHANPLHGGSRSCDSFFWPGEPSVATLVFSSSPSKRRFSFPSRDPSCDFEHRSKRRVDVCPVGTLGNHIVDERWERSEREACAFVHAYFRHGFPRMGWMPEDISKKEEFTECTRPFLLRVPDSSTGGLGATTLVVGGVENRNNDPSKEAWVACTRAMGGTCIHIRIDANASPCLFTSLGCGRSDASHPLGRSATMESRFARVAGGRMEFHVYGRYASSPCDPGFSPSCPFISRFHRTTQVSLVSSRSLWCLSTSACSLSFHRPRGIRPWTWMARCHGRHACLFDASKQAMSMHHGKRTDLSPLPKGTAPAEEREQEHKTSSSTPGGGVGRGAPLSSTFHVLSPSFSPPPIPPPSPPLFPSPQRLIRSIPIQSIPLSLSPTGERGGVDRERRGVAAEWCRRPTTPATHVRRAWRTRRNKPAWRKEDTRMGCETRRCRCVVERGKKRGKKRKGRRRKGGLTAVRGNDTDHAGKSRLSQARRACERA